MNKKVDQRGFTIVKLLIAITVSVILSGVLLGFMAGEIDQSTVATAKAALLSQAEVGLNRVNTDVRLSSNADDQNRSPIRIAQCQVTLTAGRLTAQPSYWQLRLKVRIIVFCGRTLTNISPTKIILFTSFKMAHYIREH